MFQGFLRSWGVVQDWQTWPLVPPPEGSGRPSARRAPRVPRTHRTAGSANGPRGLFVRLPVLVVPAPLPVRALRVGEVAFRRAPAPVKRTVGRARSGATRRAPDGRLSRQPLRRRTPPKRAAAGDQVPASPTGRASRLSLQWHQRVRLTVFKHLTGEGRIGGGCAWRGKGVAKAGPSKTFCRGN